MPQGSAKRDGPGAAVDDFSSIYKDKEEMACSGSLSWRGSNGIRGLQSTPMSGLQSGASSTDSIEEISALTSGVQSGAHGRRASSLRVRRGGRSVIVTGGAEQ